MLVTEHESYQRGDYVTHIAPGFLRNTTKYNILMSVLLHHAMHMATQSIDIGICIWTQLNGAARPVEGVGEAIMYIITND